jgi:tetratricopeptide (TPR) repeat protein
MKRTEEWLKSNRQHFAICGVLAAFTAAIFWPLLHAQLLNYDDPDFVTSNPHVLHGLSNGEMKWAFKSLYIYWQPLTWLSYMMDSALSNNHAEGFHRTNILLHVANSVLLYLILFRMTRAQWASAAVAAMFAWHPLHVETVAWISERKGVLSSFFWLLAVLAYEVYTRKPTLAKYTYVMVAFAFGLMSKSMVVTLPCVLLLLDYWPLRRFVWAAPAKSGQYLRMPYSTSRLVLEKLPLFLMSLGSALLTIAAQNKAEAIWSTGRLSLLARVAHSAVAYMLYLKKAFFPDDLAVFYPHPGTWPASYVIAACILLLGITVTSVRQFRMQPYLIVGWLLFIGMLGPVIGIIQTGDQALADRYSYLPLIGVFIMVVWFARDLAAKIPRALIGSAAVGALFACVVVTAAQVRHWDNSKALFEHALAVTKDNYLAETAYGSILFETGKIDEASQHFRNALAILPNMVEAHCGLAKCLLATGKFQEALENYQQAAMVKPDYAEADFGIGAILEKFGKLDDAKSAFEAGLKYSPTNALALFHLGTIYLSQGQYKESIGVLEQALQINPNWPDALNRLGWLLATNPDATIRKGDEALRLATRSCELTSFGNPQALNTLAAAQAETGHFQEAAASAEKAIELCRTTGQTNLAAIIGQLQMTYKSGRPYREKTASP